MTPNKVVAYLAEQTKDFSPPNKLRIAAAILESGRADLAYLVLRQVTDELGASLLSRVKP